MGDGVSDFVLPDRPPPRRNKAKLKMGLEIRAETKPLTGQMVSMTSQC